MQRILLSEKITKTRAGTGSEITGTGSNIRSIVAIKIAKLILPLDQFRSKSSVFDYFYIDFIHFIYDVWANFHRLHNRSDQALDQLRITII